MLTYANVHFLLIFGSNCTFVPCTKLICNHKNKSQEIIFSLHIYTILDWFLLIYTIIKISFSKIYSNFKENVVCLIVSIGNTKTLQIFTSKYFF